LQQDNAANKEHMEHAHAHGCFSLHLHEEGMQEKQHGSWETMARKDVPNFPWQLFPHGS